MGDRVVTPPRLPEPLEPFDAAEFVLREGETLHRVHSNRRGPTEANPGFGPPSRFAFFSPEPTSTPASDGPRVPVIYAAETARAAIAETVLHDSVRSPSRMNAIGPAAYLGSTLSRLRLTRNLRLADLTGLHAKRLGLDGTALSAHRDYGETVMWAAAAYRAGFDGLSYMSHRCNTDRAFVFFNRKPVSLGPTQPARLSTAFQAISIDPLDPLLFPSTGFDELVDACTAAGFEVLV